MSKKEDVLNMSDIDNITSIEKNHASSDVNEADNLSEVNFGNLNGNQVTEDVTKTNGDMTSKSIEVTKFSNKKYVIIVLILLMIIPALFFISITRDLINDLHTKKELHDIYETQIEDRVMRFFEEKPKIEELKVIESGKFLSIKHDESDIESTAVKYYISRNIYIQYNWFTETKDIKGGNNRYIKLEFSNERYEFEQISYLFDMKYGPYDYEKTENGITKYIWDMDSYTIVLSDNSNEASYYIN